MSVEAALQHKVFDLLRKTAQQTGLRAYVIGGYVRDYLLQRECKDIDVVVEGKGVEFAKAFAALAKTKPVSVFENFGTAMVKYQDVIIEFVGARKESYQRNSRNPIVEDGSLSDDQLRRDFTINAMSISLNEADYGTLIDPFNGRQDLEDQIIRTPNNPQITFDDDPLRMLRAIRFATQLSFTIHPETYDAILKLHDRVHILSQERIIDEINKMIMSKKPSVGFKLMFYTGLLHEIFPELEAMQGVSYVNGMGHKDNFFHTIKVLDNVAEVSDNLWLRWVAILHDIGKPATKRYDAATGWTFRGHEDRGARMVPQIFRRLKLPTNEKMRYVQNLVALHQRPIALVNEEVSDSAIRRIIVDAGEDLDDLLLFCHCDMTSKSEEKIARFRQNYRELANRIKEVESRDELRNWQPPVTGEMIMEAFQLKPSRVVGQIKNAVREAILDGIIPNEKVAATEYMYEIAKNWV